MAPFSGQLYKPVSPLNVRQSLGTVGQTTYKFS